MRLTQNRIRESFSFASSNMRSAPATNDDTRLSHYLQSREITSLICIGESYMCRRDLTPIGFALSFSRKKSTTLCSYYFPKVLFSGLREGCLTDLRFI